VNHLKQLGVAVQKYHFAHGMPRKNDGTHAGYGTWRPRFGTALGREVTGNIAHPLGLLTLGASCLPI
jgi:hypothetical protein